ncbi:hypothetical protein AB2B38_006000 [Balneola sp. MJW-20]|uniref:hypothetical protein n=1 Tax=Gracilimonas aurantiaca TaxID=3234185 RepID=UPI00346562E1
MMHKIAYLLTLSLLVVSCSLEKGYKEITADGKFKISIPAFLNKSNDLNPEASLEYYHLRQEFYTMVIDEPIIDVNNAIVDNNLEEYYSFDINGYAELVFEDLESRSDFKKVSEVNSKTINGLQSKHVTYHGIFEGVDISYQIRVYEGEKDYYQVHVWTLNRYKTRHQDNMNVIFNSFSEV